MPKVLPKIDYEACSCCGACAGVCPVTVIAMDVHRNRNFVLSVYPRLADKAGCLGCGACELACPLAAITMYEYDEQNDTYTIPATFPDSYEIDAERCKGCTSCKKVCPVDAIEGTVKPPHTINQDLCVQCGACYGKCGLNAIARDGVLPELKTKSKPDADSMPKYAIVTDKCKGCTACKKACPVGAIEGEVKQPHKINQEDCIECGACYEKCKLKAIVVDGVLPELEAKKPAPSAESGAKREALAEQQKAEEPKAAIIPPECSAEVKADAKIAELEPV